MDNKFISKLHATKTEKSVLELKSDKRTVPFRNMGNGYQDVRGYKNNRDSSVVVAQGSQNYAITENELIPVGNDFIGDGTDLRGSKRCSGAGFWINSSYAFPDISSINNPVVNIFSATSKWIVRFCGSNLFAVKDEIPFTFILKAGAFDITNKEVVLKKQPNGFCYDIELDFADSPKDLIKCYAGQALTVQLICNEESAYCDIYYGMSYLTLLERKVDPSVVNSTNVALTDIMEGHTIADDFFNDQKIINQVPQNTLAMPVFVRQGNEMKLVGWADSGIIRG